jgi:hypothetical protein
MAKYRTALGRTLDMSVLAAKNEKVRAVGNMKVNARGDTIDSNGRIITPVTQKVGENYANTVKNKSAQVKQKPTQQPTQPRVTRPVVKEELTAQERELEESFDDDLEIEQIKAKEMKK